MSFNFIDLNNDIRELMLQEIHADIDQNNLYFSPRLSAEGVRNYPDLLIKAATAHNEVWLANQINQYGQLNTQEITRGGVRKKVPVNAAHTMADGEFNRFYIRAVCLLAIEKEMDLEVYRAKLVETSRSASMRKIGEFVSPEKLLNDLRSNIGIDTALGLPAGPNSGLCVKLV
ncbi:MAG: hypothetical protein EOO69_04640 [Moraxellaceae bacterium]|nr:MAG: hypothetical protein EOO69_04640 [Moraxellaceae bacterium]